MLDSPETSEQSTDSQAANIANKILSAPDALAEKIPQLTETLDKIDSRQIFTDYITKIVKVIALITAFFSVVMILMAIFKGFELEENPMISKVGIIVSQLGAIVGIVVWLAVVNYRAKQMSQIRVRNVISIFFRLFKLFIELIALKVMIGLAVMGACMFLAGDKGIMSFMYGVYYLPMEELSEMLSGDASSGDDDFSLMARIGGLVMMTFSALAGFVVLLKGYVIHDLFNLFYRFFLNGGGKGDD